MQKNGSYLGITKRHNSKFHQQKSQLTIKKKKMQIGWLSPVAGCQEVAESSPLEIFKTCLDTSLSNLI